MTYDYEQLFKNYGANILAFEMFGSYQGDIIAKIEYHGEIKWLHAWYGSCCHCDPLQRTSTEEEQKNLALDMFNDMQDYDSVFYKISENREWDMSADDMINFMLQNK